MFSVAVAAASNGADQSNSSSVSITTLSVGLSRAGKAIAAQRGSWDDQALSCIEGSPDLIGQVFYGLCDLRIGVLKRCEIAAIGIGNHPGKALFLEETSQHHDRRSDERIAIADRQQIDLVEDYENR